MSSQLVYGALERKIDDTLKRLDQMVIQVEGYKPLLERYTGCTELEIKATFNNLMDNINQRQIALLKQLDKVHTEKIAVIDNKKLTIETLRDNIISSISSRHANDSRIHDLINCAESVSLSSSSAPFISFRGEHSFLPQAIANYGRVVSRYSGHFADPSQPSSCLPSAVEEEDDHEDSQEHPTVFHRASDPPNFVNPALRHWLLNNTQGVSTMKNSDTQSMLGYLFADVSGVQIGNKNVTKSLKMSNRTGSIHGCDTLSEPYTSSSIMSEPRSRISINALHSSKPNGCVNHWEPYRKQSLTLSTAGSNRTSSPNTESFTVLSGSMHSRSSNLKDWLFCDTMELCNMPGLSANLPWVRSVQSEPQHAQCAESNRPVNDFASWLVCTQANSTVNVDEPRSILSQTPNTTRGCCTRANSLLPSHLTQSGPIDLGKWLTGDHLSVDPTTVQPVETESEQSPSEAAPAVGDDVLQDPNDGATPDCCIYSRCRGGPGGPTCCGARLKYNPWKLNETITTTEVQCNLPISQGTQLSAPLSATAPAEASAVVSQLNKIASSHWTQWLTGYAGLSENLSSVGTLSSDTSPFKQSLESTDQKWLLPTTPTRGSNASVFHETDHLLGLDSSATPPKRRSTLVKTDDPEDCGLIVQSPFICVLEPNECTACSPRIQHTSRKPLKQNLPTPELPPVPSDTLQPSTHNADDYEGWLLKKMASLSTDSRANDVITLPEVNQEMRLKLE